MRKAPVPGNNQSGGVYQKPKFTANGVEWIFDSIITDPENKIEAAQMNATTAAITKAKVPEDGLKIYYRLRRTSAHSALSETAACLRISV